jgi:hypothetical protein
MKVSCFISPKELQNVDIVGFVKILNFVGYEVFIGTGILVKAFVNSFESRQHVSQELRMDVESLLKRFRIKK